MKRRDFLIGVPASFLLPKIDILESQKKQLINVEKIGADARFLNRTHDEHIRFLREIGLTDEKINNHLYTLKCIQEFADMSSRKMEQIFLDSCFSQEEVDLIINRK